MGGMGSGGHNRLSDAEKKRKGTFRKDQSAQAHNAKAVKKVVAGPWLSKIPQPSLPLDEVATKRYQEICQHLMDQGKLTVMTCEVVQAMALRHAKMKKMLDEGKDLPAYLIKEIQNDAKVLCIAEDPDQAVGTPRRSRFAGVGFSQDRTAQVSIRRVTTGRDRG